MYTKRDAKSILNPNQTTFYQIECVGTISIKDFEQIVNIIERSNVKYFNVTRG